MKSKTRLFLASLVGSTMAVVGVASFAAAAVTPTVTATVQNSSNSTITTAVIGTSVHAHVVVASTTASTSPTGTVDFSLYSNQICSGAPLTQTGVVLVNGAASSSNTVLTAAGLSYRVHYNGQSDLYTAADSPCVSINATQVAPAISLSLSNTNVQAGSSVYGVSNLTGETATASGTLQYNVYSNNTCTTLAHNAGAKTVTNGATPNSDSVQFNTPGSFWWRVAYSGDTDNTAATSSCGTLLTVVATSSTPGNPGTPGTISGTVFNDLNKDGDQDAGEPGLTGWKVWLHQKATTTAKWAKKNGKKFNYGSPIIQTATTDSNGNYSFGNLQPGTYFVEQEEPKGWDQKSSDRTVKLNDSTSSADVDFANVEKKKKNDDKEKNNGRSGWTKEDWQKWWNDRFEKFWEKKSNKK